LLVHNSELLQNRQQLVPLIVGVKSLSPQTFLGFKASRISWSGLLFESFSVALFHVEVKYALGREQRSARPYALRELQSCQVIETAAREDAVIWP
jgi:hypothetical protein